MAYEAALGLANLIIPGFLKLVQTGLQDCADGHLTTLEGLMLGVQGTQLGAAVVAILQGADAATRAELAYVLRHGEVTITLPEDAHG